MDVTRRYNYPVDIITLLFVSETILHTGLIRDWLIMVSGSILIRETSQGQSEGMLWK